MPFRETGLIFLISQPRSGSTMLQKILGANKDVHTVSEPWIALHLLYMLRERGVTAEYGHALARAAVAESPSSNKNANSAYGGGTGTAPNNLAANVGRPRAPAS